MKAIQQIAGRIETLQAGLNSNERIDVFDGACALGRNLNGGTIPTAITEIPMADWQLYNPPGEIEPGGGLLIRVPGVYLISARIRYPAGAGAANVRIGVSFGLPVFTSIQTAAVVATTDDWWQSGLYLGRINVGQTVRLFAKASAPISWQWILFGVALMGMVD